MNKKKIFVFLGLAVIAVLGVGIGFFMINDQEQSIAAEPGQQEGMVQESEDMVEIRENLEDDVAIFVPN